MADPEPSDSLTWRQRRQAKRLTYCYKRCACGALYAIDSAKRAWDCSDIILGLAIPKGEPGSVTHDDTMPFIFWKVKEAQRDWALEHRVERKGATSSASSSQSGEAPASQARPSKR